MGGSNTVLIAPDHAQQALRGKLDVADLAVYSDHQVLEALDAIAQAHPEEIVLERLFAASPRGAALIKRLKDDPSLRQTRIRVVAHDSDYARTVPRPAHAADLPDSTQFVDPAGTRATERLTPVSALDVQLDGKHVTLANLSAGGAQVTSETVLRPNQRVRITIARGPDVVRLNATVVWAAFERSKESGKPQYRAGLEFIEADGGTVQQILLRIGSGEGATGC